MSGIFGIVNLDGTPIDPQLLQRMARATIPRGPDAQVVWCSGNVGLGHALLRDSVKSEGESQPCSLDGQVWITADARIDGRAALVKSLRAAGREVSLAASNAELILHAYAVFEKSFLQHLIGDFAFALWDGRNATLTCARDHFGVRPFFYGRTESTFVFGTDLDALLKHPGICTQLDECSIGDFLLFSAPQSPAATIYRDVRRLPAASKISLTREGLFISRYWDVPQYEVRESGDYPDCVEQFTELLSKAVDDRAQVPNVAFELSGGMDSTSIGAMLMANTRTVNRNVAAYTTSFARLLPKDRELEYARLAASHLNIPLVEQQIVNYALFERSELPWFTTAEPSAYPLLATRYDTHSRIVAGGARVLLTGQGGDAVFGGPSRQNDARANVVPRLTEMYRHLRHTGTLRGLGLRSTLLSTIGRTPWHPELPDWFDSDFSKRIHLQDRWRAGWKIIDGAVGMQRQLTLPWLANGMFECFESLKLPLVVRHPFFDVRLIDFLAGLPRRISSEKKILRDAMSKRLPIEIVIRPKTYLQGDYVRAMLTQKRIATPLEEALASVAGNYVDLARYRNALARYLGGEGSKSTWTSYYMISPIALNNWLTLSYNRGIS